jgi:Baseplate J-like protein
VPLTTKTADQFVADLQNDVQALSHDANGNPILIDFASGSILGAVTEAEGRQLAFVQKQNTDLLAITRASTCPTIDDLISYVSDWFLEPPQLPPGFASSTSFVGTRTLASSVDQFIQPGVIFQTKVAAPAIPVVYQVVPDVSQTSWIPALQAYRLPAGATTVQFSAQAMNAGTASNAVVSTVWVISTPNVPLDSITNTLAITNGTPAETQGQLFARFQQYIMGLSRGTKPAVCARILEQRTGLSFTYNEYTNTDGTLRDAFVTVALDDGSGAPPSSLLSSALADCNDPVDPARAGGTGLAIIAPSVVNVTASVTGLVFQPLQAANSQAIEAAIQTAIVNFINGNGVGGSITTSPIDGTSTWTPSPSLKVSYSAYIQLLQTFVGTGVNQGLAGWGTARLNGAQADVTLTAFQLARTTAANVTVGP